MKRYHGNMRLLNVVFIGTVVAMTATWWPRPSSGAAETTVVGKSTAAQLTGSWLRPDGGYVLEIRDAAADGTLRAAYFNPRPINVARAEWTEKDGRLTVFVELRDTNYPGSTYTLQYLPKEKKMIGTYYQAVQKANFSVEFIQQDKP